MKRVKCLLAVSIIMILITTLVPLRLCAAEVENRGWNAYGAAIEESDITEKITDSEGEPDDTSVGNLCVEEMVNPESATQDQATTQENTPIVEYYINLIEKMEICHLYLPVNGRVPESNVSVKAMQRDNVEWKEAIDTVDTKWHFLRDGNEVARDLPMAGDNAYAEITITARIGYQFIDSIRGSVVMDEIDADTIVVENPKKLVVKSKIVTVQPDTAGFTIVGPTGWQLAGKKFQLKTAFDWTYEGDKKVSWLCTTPHLASIDENGKVTLAKSIEKPDTAEIVASVINNGKTIQSIFQVKVYPTIDWIKIYDGSEEVTNKTIRVDAQTVEKYVLTTKTNVDDYVEFVSGNKKIAIVDEYGHIKFKGESGKVVITAKATDGSGTTAKMTFDVYRSVREIKLTGPTRVAAGKSIRLKKAIYPQNATNQKVIWSTSDPDKATVNMNGTVTAKKGVLGDVVIKATSAENEEVVGTFYLSVCTPATQVTIRREDGTEITGKTILVDARTTKEMVLEAVSDKEQRFWGDCFKSGNTGIATTEMVEGKCIVRFSGKTGKVIISAKSTDGSELTNRVTFDVRLPVESVQITGPSSVSAGNSIQLKAQVYPEDSLCKKVKWTSSDPDKATVSELGKVHAAADASGTVIITATSTDRKEVYCKHEVNIVPAANKVQIFSEDGVEKTGETIVIDSKKTKKYPLKVLIDPSEITDFTCKSNNTKIATVDSEGNVTFTGQGGKAVITVTAADGSKVSAKVTFQVKAWIIDYKIKWNTNDFGGELAEGKRVQLTIGPMGIGNVAKGNFVWTSSDNDLATVDQTGLVTAKYGKYGRVTISLSTEETPEYKTSTEIMIVPAVTGIVLKKQEQILNNTILQVAIDPMNPETRYITPEKLGISVECYHGKVMSCSQKYAVKFDNQQLVDRETGYVKGNKGVVVCTVKALDGTKKNVHFKIRISTAVSQITINGPQDSASGKTIQLTAQCNSTATNKKLIWSTSDSNLAYVRQDGKVTIKSGVSGTVFITAAAAENPSVYAVHRIIIRPPATGVVIKYKGMDVTGRILDISYEKGKTSTLYAVVTPYEANAGVIWQSSNTQIATVDEKGIVQYTGKKGQVTIKAVSKDKSGRSAKIIIKVI